VVGGAVGDEASEDCAVERGVTADLAEEALDDGGGLGAAVAGDPLEVVVHVGVHVGGDLIDDADGGGEGLDELEDTEAHVSLAGLEDEVVEHFTVFVRVVWEALPEARDGGGEGDRGAANELVWEGGGDPAHVLAHAELLRGAAQGAWRVPLTQVDAGGAMAAGADVVPGVLAEHAAGISARGVDDAMDPIEDPRAKAAHDGL
jgi:hypothetical protein